MNQGFCFARATLVALLLGLGGVTAALSAGSILDTKHNLSMSGPGPVKSVNEGEVCVFCHAPHSARRDVPYLWNRSDSTVSYIPYQSSTLQASVGQPSGASKLCLSCHDGTVALGALVTRSQEVVFQGGVRFIPDGLARVGTDLSDDHPVSLLYDGALVASNPQLRSPSILPPQVKLDRNGELQCTACHDPHADTYGKFLVMTNQYSGLCITCHQQDGWPQSSHATSNRPWNGVGADPWGGSAYATVAENGCASCHVPHAAGSHERLMNFAVEEDNCLVCHTGNVASANLDNELTKRYGHFVQNYSGVHDPAERATVGGMSTHVECADCHNSHQSNATASPGAPLNAGATSGVSGIDQSGQPVASTPYQYEICLKCHGDNNVATTFPISRQIPQLNTRLQFAQGNPSFHPVMATGVNSNVPSLLPPYTTASRIFCTDCHGNDDAGGPRGPHGSNNAFLLAGRYLTADNTTESPTAYELCYGCHSRASILADQSFKEHDEHVVDENTPCSACHDAHGISATQGNPVNNPNLINFDLSIVQPDASGRLSYEKTGTFKGSCYLNCHGKEHSPKNY